MYEIFEINSAELAALPAREIQNSTWVYPECRSPKLPASPTRSIGGYFDYGAWKERDRFLELDRAIIAYGTDRSNK